MRYLLILICTLFIGCSQKQFDKEKETKAILEITKKERAFHINKKAEHLTNLFSPSFTSINKGEVITPGKQESTNRFKAYFNAVEFEKWDNTEKPIINFSDDGSIAYVTIQKEVIITYTNKEKQKVKETTYFAWMAIYKKYDEQWKIESMVSTNKPSEREII